MRPYSLEPLVGSYSLAAVCLKHIRTIQPGARVIEMFLVSNLLHVRTYVRMGNGTVHACTFCVHPKLSVTYGSGSRHETGNGR